MKAIIFSLFAILAICIMSSPAKAQDCATCEYIISIIETYAENNQSEEFILQALDSLCTLFPSYASTCDAIAAQGLDEVISWINQNESPQTICTQLGQCSSSKSSSIKHPLPKFSDLKNFKIPSKLSRPSHKLSTHQIGDAECSGCEEVISIIEQWLDQSDNQDEVITAIEVVCTFMPDWETTCDAMIEAEVPNVVDWIEKYENATMVCNQLQLCGASKLIRVSDNCGDCQQIVAAVENWVATSSTESQIESYLDVACTLVPQWTNLCDAVIAQSVPQIVSWAEANETPQTICTNLDVC